MFLISFIFHSFFLCTFKLHVSCNHHQLWNKKTLLYFFFVIWHNLASLCSQVFYCFYLTRKVLMQLSCPQFSTFIINFNSLVFGFGLKGQTGSIKKAINESLSNGDFNLIWWVLKFTYRWAWNIHLNLSK